MKPHEIVEFADRLKRAVTPSQLERVQLVVSDDEWSELDDWLRQFQTVVCINKLESEPVDRIVVRDVEVVRGYTPRCCIGYAQSPLDNAHRSR